MGSPLLTSVETGPRKRYPGARGRDPTCSERHPLHSHAPEQDGARGRSWSTPRGRRGDVARRVAAPTGRGRARPSIPSLVHQGRF